MGGRLKKVCRAATTVRNLPGRESTFPATERSSRLFASDSRVPQLRQIDEICDRFEQGWLAGQKLSLQEIIATIPETDRLPCFRELLEVELELRRGEQQRPTRDEYLRQFPEFSEMIVDAFAGGIEETPRLADGVSGTSQSASPPADAPAVVIRVVAGPHAGAEFAFRQYETFFVGRSTRAQLRVQGDPHFSRFHFRLEVNPPFCHLIDLGSRNGTFVNGKPVRECDLHHGDVISGGVTELRIDSSLLENTAILSPEPVAEAPIQPPAKEESTRTPAACASAAERQMPFSPDNLEIPGYELHEILKRTDIGVVHRAVKQSTRRECALKVMPPSGAVSEKMLQIFLRECSLLGQLNHPHIVRFLDQGSAGGCLYLATEYFPTISLVDHIRKRSLQARIRICCGLMLQILDALQYAHSRSLVHRDIRPDSISVSRDDKALTARLSDFGVAKRFIDAGFSQITRAGDVVGSLPFMPPEQFVNSREVRPTCDLYAAGATLYSWLTGSTPHDFPREKNQFLVVLEDQPVPISQRIPDIPPPLSAFLDRALARRPEDRFSSAQEMQYVLQGVVRM